MPMLFYLFFIDHSIIPPYRKLELALHMTEQLPADHLHLQRLLRQSVWLRHIWQSIRFDNVLWRTP